MANPEHVAKLKEGVEAWNRWRHSSAILPSLENADLRGLTLRQADLIGAKLDSASLAEVDLYGANLAGANLSNADLRRASLLWANLKGTFLLDANLSEARLGDAILDHAVLIRANLNSASLHSATLNGTMLGGASFADVGLGDSVFGNVDLSEVFHLETVRHNGPSSIGIDTLYRSAGRISATFLRGCGVSDTMIRYAHSLTADPIVFYSCFISYSHKDNDFAERLHADLQNAGVRCWFAPHDIAGGRKIHEQLEEAVRIYERLLLILSPASMNSEWVKTEIAHARQKELTQKRQVLFPLGLVDFETIRQWKAFDADTGKDSAREIREYFIPDFSEWENHKAYKPAFDRLLRDLRAKDAATA